jgi:Spy/CpxP family protein refolding chaperone
MKKLMMILVAAAMTTATALAQEAKQPPPKKSPEERAGDITARMTKTLALNADQQQKVKEMILKRETEREAAMKKARGSREQMETQMDADLQKILTPEQYDKYKKKREEMKKKHEEKRMAPDAEKGVPPPPAPAPEPK